MLAFIPKGAPKVNQGSQGQIALTTSQTFIVPANVKNICVVAVGAGGQGGANVSFGWPAAYIWGGSGGGGALCWANELPVEPGDTITVNIGTLGSQVDTTIVHNGIVLVRAAAGRNGTDATYTPSAAGKAGMGGNFSVHSSIKKFGGGKGGNGSDGSFDFAATSARGGGAGAGGYSGSGGSAQGGKYQGFTGAGGGGGGGCSSPGGGVGLTGQGANGAGATSVGTYGGNGSLPLPCYGGGHQHAGAVRFIWGPKRAFPSTLTKDQTVEA